LIEPDKLFTLDGYIIRLLGRGDLSALQDLLVACTDYSILVDGSPADKHAAASLLESLPDGKSIEQKKLIGVFQQTGGLVGILDAIQDYPADGAWWVGLLLVDPSLRNQGLGRKIYYAFENWIYRQGCIGVCLGVVEENDQAFKFWISLGFEEYARQPARQFGNKTHTIINMAKHLPEKHKK
jgi:GNAT superfamily N-acetyltransferase